jgi:hypothetical protein
MRLLWFVGPVGRLAEKRLKIHTNSIGTTHKQYSTGRKEKKTRHIGLKTVIFSTLRFPYVLS